MDRLRQIDTFLRVARSSSFTAVAAQLGQSPAAVTRHINALETHLGVRLLNRSTRSISLTDAGKSYAELCERVIEDIARSEAQLSAAEKEPTGSIKLIVPKTFGTMQLGDAIVSFSVKHPNIALSILFENSSFRAQDFIERGYDLALRWGSGSELRNSTLVSTQLGTLPRKLCASPEYLQRQGPPGTPADLEQANCLVHLIASSGNIWRFTDGEREIGVKVRGNLNADSAAMLRKAALAGRGVTILPLFAIQDDLKSGALVELLPDYPVPAHPLSVLYREKRLLPSRVRLLIDFLRDWFNQYTHRVQSSE